MYTFLIILFSFFQVSNQWREYRDYECYVAEISMDSILKSNFSLERQKCEASSLYNACKSDIIDGVFYSGCMDKTFWNTNFLCSPLHSKREYKKQLDFNGVFIFDTIQSWCCRGNLCNDHNYLRTIITKQQVLYSNTLWSIITELIAFILSFILIVFIIMCELMSLKPMVGRFDVHAYKTKNLNIQSQ